MITWQKIEFEKHPGFMDMETKCVSFYNLLFDNLFHAGKFLDHIHPGNYKGWVQGEEFGIIDLNTGTRIKFIHESNETAYYKFEIV